AFSLAILPLLPLLGFSTLALMPTVATLVVFQVLRRSCDYAVARPTREVLYTVVPREDRYKAKTFIDTVVYRAGDQIGAWSYALVALLGFAPPILAAIAIVLALLWLINAWWLGRRQSTLAPALSGLVGGRALCLIASRLRDLVDLLFVIAGREIFGRIVVMDRVV